MQLGNNCEYVLDLGNEIKRFSSEQELDLFLKTKVEELGEGFSIIDKTFSVNPKEKTKKILEECRVTVKSESKEFKVGEDPEDYELIEYIPHSIGITEFISTYGLDSDWTLPITPGFNQKAWMKDAIQKYKEGAMKSGMSEEDALKKAQDTIQSVMDTWPSLTEIGNEVHKVIEETINGTPLSKTTKLSESQVKDIETQTKVFMDSLRSRHGKNCEFYTEFSIKSKELNPKMAEILKTAGKDSLNGRIDLLVIDD